MSGECDYCGSDQHVETTCPKTKDPAVMWRDVYGAGYAAGWNANNQRSAFATPPPSHIIDDTGTVRKVLGELPMTADGCVIGVGAEVHLIEYEGHHTKGTICMGELKIHTSVPTYRYVPSTHLYSTEQAAREAGGKA